MIYAKIQPQSILGSGEENGHGGHLGQWTATIIAIFHSPALERLQRKFEQHCPRASIGEAMGKQTWPCGKKVKCQRTTIILAISVDLPSLIIYTKIQPQGILSSGEENF